MCLLGIAIDVVPCVRLFLFANREEAYARPSEGPAIHRNDDGVLWYGGLDLVAGGTWLGVNQFGLTAAVTNRSSATVPSAPRSRGLLCRDLLSERSVAAATQRAREEFATGRYQGCNLLLASREESVVLQYTDRLEIRPLEPGLHVMTNGEVDDLEDRRIAAAFERLRPVPMDTPDIWMSNSQWLCGFPGDNCRPAICLKGSDRGTVSSTILMICDTSIYGQYHHAAGPPGRTYYGNFSQELREVLLQGGNPLDAEAIRFSRIPGFIFGPNVVPHVQRKMSLLAPWRSEFRLGSNPDLVHKSPMGINLASLVGSTQIVKSSFPFDCRRLTGGLNGTLLLSRRFHKPTGLDEDERVYLSIERFPGPATVWLNGQFPETLLPKMDNSWAVDITPFLRGNEELTVELQTDNFPKHKPAKFGPVQLEICKMVRGRSEIL